MPTTIDTVTVSHGDERCCAAELLAQIVGPDDRAVVRYGQLALQAEAFLANLNGHGD